MNKFIMLTISCLCRQILPTRKKVGIGFVMGVVGCLVLWLDDIFFPR